MDHHTGTDALPTTLVQGSVRRVVRKHTPVVYATITAALLLVCPSPLHSAHWWLPRKLRLLCSQPPSRRPVATIMPLLCRSSLLTLAVVMTAALVATTTPTTVAAAATGPSPDGTVRAVPVPRGAAGGSARKDGDSVSPKFALDGNHLYGDLMLAAQHCPFKPPHEIRAVNAYTRVDGDPTVAIIRGASHAPPLCMVVFEDFEDAKREVAKLARMLGFGEHRVTDTYTSYKPSDREL